MDGSPDEETYQELHEWTYEPGLLDYAGEGAGANDLPEALLARSSVSRGSPKAQKLLDWLRGCRLEGVLCEREPIWVPLVEAWAAPGGSFEFTYESSSELGGSAEVKVFALGGVGGASSRKVSTSVHWQAEAEGRGLDIRAFVTIRRYVLRTGEHLDRVDVDCSGEQGEYRNHQLGMASHPFAGLTPGRADILAAKYAVTHIERCREVAGPTEFTFASATQRSWSFGPDLDIPMLQSALKLQVDLGHAKSFTTTFTLPGGQDYAFCSRIGESPVAPVCVVLSHDDGRRVTR
jgi:hypothetical protein